MIRKLVKKLKLWHDFCAHWMSFCMYRTYDVQNLWYLHPKFSSDDNPSATWIFFGGKNIWLFTSSCTTFFISSRNSKLFFLYLGPKLFRFWLQPVVENHNHLEKMMMLSFLAYEIRTDDRVYVKFIFKYISEFFTAILIK